MPKEGENSECDWNLGQKHWEWKLDKTITMYWGWEAINFKIKVNDNAVLLQYLKYHKRTEVEKYTEQKFWRSYQTEQAEGDVA